MCVVALRDVCSIGSPPDCGRSNSGSYPGNLPNIVHKVKIPGRSTGTWEQKELIKNIIYFSDSIAWRTLPPSVADPERFDADPDPTYYIDADPDPTYYIDADPDPTFYIDADPDPNFT